MATALSFEPDHNRLQGVLDRIGDLAVLPHVVFKVLEISAESADSAGIEMERAIIIDPGFSSRILIRANSAAYGLPRKLVSIKEAIAFLGYRAIRNVAMTVGVFDVFIGKNDKTSLRRRRWWRQSLDAAICARWLARETRAGYPEEAYTCSLLHLLGKTLLDKLGEGEYEHVDQLVKGGIGDIEAERRVFGVDHVQLAAAAATLWGLPLTLVTGLDYTSAITLDDPSAQLRALTATSNFIALAALDGWDDDPNDIRIPTWALEVLSLKEEKFCELTRSGIAVIAAAGRDD